MERDHRRRVTVVLASTALAGVLAACSATTDSAPSGTGPAASTPSLTGTIRALSYNVAGLPAGLSGSRPDVNTPLISPKLNAYDLVLVQEDWIDPVPPVEGFDFHHDDLVSAVDHPFRSTPDPPPLGRDPRRPAAQVSDGLNVLSRLPLDGTTRVMWDDCVGGLDTSDGGAGDCLALKGFMLTRVTLAVGVTVDIYNLHGEAGGTPADQRLQAADYRQLAEFITATSAGRAVILAGDTNLHTDARHRDAGGTADREIWRSFLTATGLSDVCDAAGGEVRAPSAPVDCGTDADVIDKAALRSASGIELVARSHRFEDDVFVGPDGQPLSDHRALAVTIDWHIA